LKGLFIFDEPSRPFNRYRGGRGGWEQSRGGGQFRDGEQNKENNQSAELSAANAANINFAVENASYAFGNMTISTDLDSNENLLRYSVTYDFGAFNHLT
jgi:hypothetical protein